MTAIEIHVVSNTGAYGGHGSETLAAALGSPMAVYRCTNKKAIGYAVYTNMVPGGGFRGYGASQTTFAIESAIDDLAKLLKIDPFEIRRKNMIRPTDWVESVWKDPSDASFGSYGLDQCMDIVESAMAKGGGAPKPEGDEWAEGSGIGLSMLECGPPTEHRSGAQMTLRSDGTYHLAVGSTEMGNGSVTSHRQIAASLLGRARRRSTSSMPIRISAPTIPARSQAPVPWSPVKRSSSPPKRCATTSSSLQAATPASSQPTGGSKTQR